MASKTPPVLGLHHAAYRCRDAEETRHFYEDILGPDFPTEAELIRLGGLALGQNLFSLDLGAVERV